MVVEGPADFSQSEAKMFLCRENMFGRILKLKSQSQPSSPPPQKRGGGEGGCRGGGFSNFAQPWQQADKVFAVRLTVPSYLYAGSSICTDP